VQKFLVDFFVVDIVVSCVPLLSWCSHTIPFIFRSLLCALKCACGDFQAIVKHVRTFLAMLVDTATFPREEAGEKIH